MPPHSKTLDLNDILTKEGNEAALEWLTTERVSVRGDGGIFGERRAGATGDESGAGAPR
jgi:hypothetical protein